MEPDNKCLVSARSKKKMVDYKSCTLEANGEKLEVRPEGKASVVLPLSQIEGVIISSTKEIIQVYTLEKEGLQVQLAVKWFDRLKFLDLLTAHMTRLPVWFTVEQDLNDFFKKVGGDTFFDEPQKNEFFEELKDDPKGKLHQFFILKGTEARPTFPHMYSKIMFTYDRKGMSMDDLEFQTAVCEKSGLSAKIYHAGSVRYLVNAIKEKEFKDTNVLNSIGTNVELAQRIMDYSKGIMPIHYIFEDNKGSDDVLVAIPLEHEEVSLEEKIESQELPDFDNMEEWEERVKVYAQQLATAILYLHNHKIIHRKINLRTVLVNNKNEFKLLITQTARYLDQGTAKTTVFNDKNRPEVVQKGEGYSWEFDWNRFGCVLSSLFRQSTDEDSKIVPTGISAGARAFLKSTLASKVEDKDIEKDQWLNLAKV